jgi:WD40 repeat protein
MATVRSKSYAAFLSYNREADRHLAQALQNALHGFAKPWYRLRALRIFRDDAALSANPGLWSSVRKGLDDANYFILLASPQAAQSEWVGKEVAHWREHQPADRVLIALTSGDIVWDAAAGDFDWSRTTALPPQLRGAFREEPRYVDLRGARDLPEFSRSRVFRELVADIAAPLHNKAKDELIGEDRRLYRRARRLATGGVITLAVLTVAATLFGVEARRQAIDATRQRDLAEDRLQIATAAGLVAQADAIRDRDPRTALLLGIAAQDIHADARTRASLTETVTTSRYATTLATPEGVRVLAFSPDNRWLATGGYAGTVQIWDVSTPTSPRKLGQFNVAASDGAALSIAFAPDGHKLAVGTLLDGTTLWDITDPTQPRRYGTPLPSDGRGDVVTFSPDGRTLAVGTSNSAILRYDVTEPANPKAFDPLTQPGGNSEDVTQLSFSRDGKTLTGVALGGMLAAWDVTDPAHATLRTDPVEPDGFYRLLSPDADKLITIGDNSDLTVFFLNEPGKLFTFGRPALQPGAYHGSFSADGSHAVTASSNGTAAIWTTNGFGLTQVGRPLVGLLGQITATAVSTVDGGVVATGNADGSVVLWTLGSPARPGPHAETLQPPRPDGGFVTAIRGVAFAPNGKTIATVDEDHKLMLWDRTDPASLRQIGTPLTGVSGPLQFSPDATMLLTGDVVLLDLSDRSRPRELSRPEPPDGRGGPSAFSPDGRSLAVGTKDGVALMDIGDPTRPSVIGIATGAPSIVAGVTTLAYAPDGRTLAVGWSDNTVTLWDVADPVRPTQLGDKLAGPTAAVTGIAFSPAGHLLATAGSDGTAILWRVDNAARPTRIGVDLGRREGLSGLGFSPDGRTLFIAERNSGDSVTMWDLSDTNPRPLGSPIVVPGGAINAFALAPDGLGYAVAGGGGEFTMWDVTAVYAQRDDPVSFACAITGRGLDPGEWGRYVSAMNYRETCAH